MVALVTRAAYWAWATPDRPLVSDAGQYQVLAENLATGRGFSDVFPQLALHPTAYRPPLYPIALSVVYRIVGVHEGVGRAVNVVIGVTVVVAVVALVSRQLGPRAGLIGGLAVAFAPNLIANDTYVLTEPLSLLLVVGLVWFLLDERWVLAGVVLGALVLTRPSAQYLVIPLVIWLVVRIDWRRAAGFAAIVALVVAPWVGRNWVVLGSPVLVTSNGFNLAAMYSPPAQQVRTWVDPVFNPWFFDRASERFDEIAWDRNLTALGVDEIRRQPTLVPKVMVRNALAYFEIQPLLNTNAEQADGRAGDASFAAIPFFYALAVVGAAGCWRLRREPIIVLSALIGAYFTVASLVLVAPPRLRSPLDLVLCIGLAAWGAKAVDGRLDRSKPGATAEVGEPVPA